MADFILQDNLVEILKRLPIKSLLRFKCVQKSWYHLIRSRYFIDLHFHHQNKKKYLLFQDRYHSNFFLRVDDEQCNEYHPRLQGMPIGVKNKIHGTCRGLICISAQEKINSRRLTVYLWNLATRIYKILPSCPDALSDHQYHRDLAFGYFPKINDYKAIKFQSYCNTKGEDRQAPTVHIYSLSTDSWKTVGEDNIAQFSRYRKLYNPVIVNGVGYWVGIKEDPFMQVIVCFDVENEKIREIMLPRQYALDVSMGHISSFNLVQHFDEVLLSAVYMNWYANTCNLDIFSLGKGDGEDLVCTKKVTIDLKKVGETWWPIGFRHSGEIVLFNFDYTGGVFWSYDHEKKVATEILDNSWYILWPFADITAPEDPGYDDHPGLFDLFDAGEEHMQFMYVYSFEESLVLLDDDVKFVESLRIF